MKSKYLDAVAVSTDSEKIANVAKAYGAEVPGLRPKELGVDTAPVIDALLHTIGLYEQQRQYFDYLLLLQATQPLRQVRHIDEAIEKIVDLGGESLVGINEYSGNPLLIRTINKDKNKVERIIDSSSTVRRQDLPKFYKVNGAIYINKINENFNNSTSLNDNEIPYIMDSCFDLDIDEYKDLERFVALTTDSM